MLLPRLLGQHACVLTCLPDSRPETAVMGLEPVTFESVFYTKLEKGTQEFPGQPITLTLYAQMVDRWCES